jgi:hypothetical protein
MPSTSQQQEQLQYQHHQLLQQFHLQKQHQIQQLRAEMESNNNNRQQPPGANYYNSINAVTNNTAQNPLSRGGMYPPQYYPQAYRAHPYANNPTYKPSSEPPQYVLPPNHPFYYQQPQRAHQSSTQSPKLQRPLNLPPLQRAYKNSRVNKTAGLANQSTNSGQFPSSQLQNGNQPPFSTEPPQSEHQTLPSLPQLQHARRPPVPTNQSPVQYVQHPPPPLLQSQFAQQSTPPYLQSLQHQSVIQSPISSTIQKLPGEQMDDRFPVLSNLLYRPNKPGPKPKPTSTIVREEQQTVETIQQPSTSQQNIPQLVNSSPQNIPQSPTPQNIPQPVAPQIIPEPSNPQNIPEPSNAQNIFQNIPQSSHSQTIPESITSPSQNTSSSPENNILPSSPISAHIPSPFPIQYSDPRKRLSLNPYCTRGLVDLRFTPFNHEVWAQYNIHCPPREKNRTVALISASNFPSWAHQMTGTVPASQQYEPSYVPPLQSPAQAQQLSHSPNIPQGASSVMSPHNSKFNNLNKIYKRKIGIILKYFYTLIGNFIVI